MRLVGIRSLVAVTALALLVGCGGAAASSGAAPSGAAPSNARLPDGPRATWPTGVTALAFDDVLRYTCRGRSFAFEPSFLEQEGNAETGDDPIAGALRAHLATAGMETDWLPDSGWLLIGADNEIAEFVAPQPDGGTPTVFVRNGASGWKVDGWSSGCGPTLVLPDGLGPAEWMSDPGHPEPNAGARSINVLVTERSCASGQPSVGRVVGPAIRYEAERVLVAFGVIPQPGDFFDCQGNPQTPSVVELEEPLGDRELIDASSLPYVDVREVDPLGY